MNQIITYVINYLMVYIINWFILIRLSWQSKRVMYFFYDVTCWYMIFSMMAYAPMWFWYFSLFFFKLVFAVSMHIFHKIWVDIFYDFTCWDMILCCNVLVDALVSYIYTYLYDIHVYLYVCMYVCMSGW